MHKDPYFYENLSYKRGYSSIAGACSEGKTAWAGPISVAACVFPKNYKNTQIKDSKLLSSKKRDELFNTIIKDATAYSVIFVSPQKIDKIGSNEASVEAIKKVLIAIKNKCDFALIDTLKIPNFAIKNQTITKSSSKSITVAAASILAKVSRDRFMIEIGKKWPQYNFHKHKGIGTTEHLKLLRKHGPKKTIHHYNCVAIKNVILFINKNK